MEMKLISETTQKELKGIPYLNNNKYLRINIDQAKKFNDHFY